MLVTKMMMITMTMTTMLNIMVMSMMMMMMMMRIMTMIMVMIMMVMMMTMTPQKFVQACQVNGLVCTSLVQQTVDPASLYKLAASTVC